MITRPRSLRLVVAVVGLGVLSVPGSLSAQDWPEFRGPDGQGHSTERGVPLEWSESRNLAWKTAVPGQGWSTPIVSGGRVWLTTAVADRGVSLRALAYDIATGREVVNVEVFRTRSDGAIHPKNSRASPSPIVEGDRVYVHFGAEGTAALTSAGEIVWKERFRYESQHGAGGSPVLHGDLLILNCDGDDAAFVVALDKRTGKTRWRTSRRQPWAQAYTTPLVIRVGERDQIVSVGAFRAAAYEPETGKEIWRVGYGDGFSNVPRPVYGQRVRLYRHRVLPADDRCGPARRHRRRVEDAYRLDAAAGRAADAVAAPRRRRALRRDRHRHRLVPGRAHRRDRLATAPQR